MQDILDLARTMFVNGPVGTWALNSASPFAQFALDFRRDGSGTIEYSASGADSSVVEMKSQDFSWSSEGPLRMRVSYEAGDFIDCRFINYDFVIIRDDYGYAQIALYEQEQEERPNSLFYLHPPELTLMEYPSDLEKLEEMLDSLGSSL